MAGKVTNMLNTIILKKGYVRLTDKEYSRFTKGDTIFGENSAPEEIKRWGIDEVEKAKEELAKYKCEYSHGYFWDIEEYALEYCECDEDGEFIQGSDFELAKEA